MMPSLTGLEAPPRQEDQGSANNRQLAAVLFVVIMLVSFVAALSYMIGRLSEATAQTPYRPQPVQTRGPEQLIVVEPASTPAPAPATARLAAPLPQKPAEAKAIPAVAPSTPATATREPDQAGTGKFPLHDMEGIRIPAAAVSSPLPPPPAPGLFFLQVAAVDRRTAEMAREYISGMDLAVRLGEASIPDTYRVLIGPLAGAEVIDRAKARLEKAGFSPFLRQY